LCGPIILIGPIACAQSLKTEPVIEDLFLYELNENLRVEGLPVRMRVDCTPPILSLYSMNYYEYMWDDPIKWQVETYSMLPTQGARFVREAGGDSFLFGTVSLTLLRGRKFVAGYSLGGKCPVNFPPSYSAMHSGTSEYLGLMCGIAGEIGNGAGVGAFIETNDRLIYNRFWVPASK
jgi:hypothetical protein